MELHNRTLGQWLEHWAETTPDKEYIVYSDRDLRFTWSEFNKRVDDMAKGMLGVIVSFAILFVAVVAVYLVARGALLPFLVGELGGFFVCWVAVAMAVIAYKG